MNQTDHSDGRAASEFPAESSAASPAEPREPAGGTDPGSSGSTGADAVRARLAAAGVLARPLRRVLALLAEGPQPLDELVRRCAVPRRTVEQLLDAAGADVELTSGEYRLTSEAASRYRADFALDEVAAPPEAGSGRSAELDALRAFTTSAPRPNTALDHVSATPETLLRRAEWLLANYDLGGAKLLCLGDHDLTSLAVALLAPSVEITVVDLDEQVLAHVDRISSERGLAVRTLHADLRFGLPPSVQDWADLVFTDPPYTPEGVGLFAARAAQCCAGANSRVLLAYGFSDRGPALGLKVQRQLLRLGLVFEAVLPGFHRYDGAQAIGSASDLYVCQPTAQARKIDPDREHRIYTRGAQSVEADERGTPTALRGNAVRGDALRVIEELGGGALRELREPDWTRPVRQRGEVAFDLRADPGPWLLRMLLACEAREVSLLVRDDHPDTTSSSIQRGLSELVRDKYELRFHRSSPDTRHAVVRATSTSDEGADRVRSGLLHRAHGKLGNRWREALIAASGGALSKREAKQRVADLAPEPRDLDQRLIDLPRHRLAELLARASSR